MGLFEFVFGKGAPKDDSEPKQSYYLSDDDAKTFGNIEYMRSTKVVKRTFAKQKGQTEHMESIRQISATTAKSLEGNNSNGVASTQPAVTFSSFSTPAPAPPAPAAPAPAAPATPAPVASSEAGIKPAETAAPTARRKPSSDDMDMFRNMAKNMRR